MRLWLLPISTRRSLIYCEPLRNVLAPQVQGTGALANLRSKMSLDWVVAKANVTWADWEKDDKALLNWKKRTTSWGNMVFRRIPFEEWSLKTLPPMKKVVQKSQEDGPIAQQAKRVEIRYPGLYQDLCQHSIKETLEGFVGRRGSHQKKMWYSLVGMPFTIPVGLLPIIPNIPFFYLAFRFYSHWKAKSGSEHLEQLLKNSVLHPVPYPTLDSLYSSGLLYPNRDTSRKNADPSTDLSRSVVEHLRAQTNEANGNGNPHPAEGLHTNHPGDEEVMLLHGWNGKLIAERLKLPGLEVEIERAVEQVEKSIQKEPKERMDEKKEVEELAKNTIPRVQTMQKKQKAG